MKALIIQEPSDFVKNRKRLGYLFFYIFYVRLLTNFTFTSTKNFSSYMLPIKTLFSFHINVSHFTKNMNLLLFITTYFTLSLLFLQSSIMFICYFDRLVKLAKN